MGTGQSGEDVAAQRRVAGELVDSEGFTAERRAVEIDAFALAVARRVVEDVLVDLRDRRVSVMCGNGLVIRERNGGDSDVLRLSTRDALQIGIQAYTAALRHKP